MKRERPNFGSEMYVQVLGCGSARPTRLHGHSAQVLRLRDKVYLIDCGEGTQMRCLEEGISFGNLHRIFISHLHGDHVFGLPGLLSTMSLSGLEHPVHIYGPKGIKEFVAEVVRFCCREDEERLIAHEIAPRELEPIYEDGSLMVSAFPLKHRIPTIGYRFDEHPKSRPLLREMADFYGVPIAYFNRIKQGADYQKPDGTVVPNRLLTSDPPSPGSYAYCSDTAFSKEIVPWIRGVGLLYHEATFEKKMIERAEETRHSTTIQAATIAKLAEVEQLMIGHYSARYSTPELVEILRTEATEVFPNTIAAKQGGIYKVPARKDRT